MTTWLPFGYMCLHNIAAKYIDTGVTDAITKHDAYIASKTFTPSNITKWVSGVPHAWTGWRNTVTDPEHMSSVELVREILSSDNKDWKSWAHSFATQSYNAYPWGLGMSRGDGECYGLRVHEGELRCFISDEFET